MEYPVEAFTSDERALLEPHFSNLDRPVFAVTNLPETVKAALFARYSRFGGTLRRLFLDEFAGALPPTQRVSVGDVEGERAAGLFERVFVGYGDDSVAQLGGAHIACEWSSNLLTKILERPRVAAYLEQSTRYIAYNQPITPGRHRHYADERLGPVYARAMPELFTAYGDLLASMSDWYADRFPRPDDVVPRAHERAIRAKALDTARGLLPAAALSHVGIYASGQTYEQLILHMLAHPLPEAKRYGEWMLDAVRAVMPSFVARVLQPDRGGRWIEFLHERRANDEELARRLDGEPESAGPSVRLLDVHGDEEDLICAALFEASELPETRLRDAVRALPSHARADILRTLVPFRDNRRHRPNRGFERVRYRFEVVSDYGAFRDLQRHRMLTAQWQRFTPALGAEVPPDVAEAGHSVAYERAITTSEEAFASIDSAGLREEAAYALCLAFRIRYILDLDAREAMHLIELRSGVQGHPSYRAVALEMHRHIGHVHPAIAAAMTHMDTTEEPRLERLLAEIRNEGRRP